MRIVIAIGGNSLIKDEKNAASAAEQYEQILKTSNSLVKALDNNDEIVITHGNGPQVGYLLRMSEKAKDELPPLPLDYCVADTQGSIGYQIQMALNKVMEDALIDKKAVTIITQVVVSEDDPAFKNPTKPIGAFLDEREIKQYAEQFGWKYIEDAGRGYRRVVPSPKPISIIEKECIEALLENNFVVIACGGGGIPVVKSDGGFLGVEAVIDKDSASSLLATLIKADLFVVSTAVDYVYINYRTAQEKPLKNVSIPELKRYLSDGCFGKGSMEPKVRACIEFTERTGNRSVITSPQNIKDAIMGISGTQITL
jgi:carbamate kinase